MSTDAKRAGNARYLAKLKTVTVRMQPEVAGTIQQAAQIAGESVNAYILEAVRRRMVEDGYTPGLVKKEQQDENDQQG